MAFPQSIFHHQSRTKKGEAMTRTYVLLPLSEKAMAEIKEQITLRGQADRVRVVDGCEAVDLSDVMVVCDPSRMMTGGGK